MAAEASFRAFLLLLSVADFITVAAQNNNFIFNGFAGVTNITFDGDATITTGGVLQLTNDTINMYGRAFFSSAVPLLQNRSAVSFSTTFVFQIIPSGSTGGHGLAFAISPTKPVPSPGCCPYLGLFGRANNGNVSNHVVAAEFDTARGFSFFTSESHVGLLVNSIVSVSAASPAYYDSATNQNVTLDFLTGDALQAWVDYDGPAKVFNITLAPLNVAKPAVPLLSYGVDLSPILNPVMYVGFTSSTGQPSSSHYISGWSFRLNGQPQALNFANLPLAPRPSPAFSGKKLSSGGVVGITFAATLVVVASVIVVYFYLRQRAKLAEKIEDWEMDYPHRYPYKDLYEASRGFRETELLGKGAFGHVYKGVLRRTGEEVAVKRISNSSQQGIREFIAEISSLGRLRHRNLVPLQGWCKRYDDLLLVYDFMPNGSLDTLLFDKEQKKPLSWEQRYKIVKGIALGLLYLHEEWEQVVVHRDIKASNVLLDDDMNGRLGDFGLSRLYEHGENPHTTHVVGTLGYMAPELSRTGKAAPSSDVFAYGALLLEVACGRRPIETAVPPEEKLLLNWVRMFYMKGELPEVVDPKLRGVYDREEVELVLKLGLLCTRSSPEARPSMRQVNQFLNGEDFLSDGLVLQFSDTDSMELASRFSNTSTLAVSTASLRGGT